MDHQRAIIHLDFDTLYVAVERALNPRLRDRPVAVGGAGSQRGVITGVSREAQAAGIMVQMPLSRAQRLCPDLIVIPGDDELYRNSVHAVLRRLLRFSPVWERPTIDRLYLDVTGSARLFGCAVDTSAKMIHELKSDFCLDPTVGVAINKLVSKVASDSVLSGGICDVPPGSETQFLAPLPVGRLPGVGWKTQKRLGDFNIHLIRELSLTGQDFLVSAFGNYGRLLSAYALGLDDSPVGEQRQKRSAIIVSETLSHDSNDPEYLAHLLHNLIERATFRLRRERLWTQRLNVTVTFIDKIERNQSLRLPHPTDIDREIIEPAEQMLRHLLERRLAVRKLGVRFTQLRGSLNQLTLLDSGRGYDRRRAQLSAIDRIRSTYGFTAIRTGSACA